MRDQLVVKVVSLINLSSYKERVGSNPTPAINIL